MATRKEDRPYQEMGNLLESWRNEKYRSALALFKSSKFSFSYSAYADFERGVTLPSIEALLELTGYFGKDPGESALLWAKIQMPTPELKSLFTGRKAASTPSETSRPHLVAAPSLDNTWVFGPKEKSLLLKNPSLVDCLVSLLMAYPKSIPISHLTKKPSLLQAWIKSGHLVKTGKEVQLKYRHLHIPKTLEWDPIRKKNILRALDAILNQADAKLSDAQKCFYEVSHRPFTPEQVKQFVSALKRLEHEYRAIPYADSQDDLKNAHALVIAFGPRKLA